jgi:hypothetical protein
MSMTNPADLQLSLPRDTTRHLTNLGVALYQYKPTVNDSTDT